MGIPLNFKQRNQYENESVCLYIQESNEDLPHGDHARDDSRDETFLPDDFVKNESKQDVHVYKNPQTWNSVAVLDILRRSYSLSQNALKRYRHGSDTCPIETGSEDCSESELQTTPLHSKVPLSRSYQFASKEKESASAQNEMTPTSATSTYEPTTSLISEVILSTTAPFLQEPHDFIDPLSRPSSRDLDVMDKIYEARSSSKPRKAVRFIALDKSDSCHDNITLSVANTTLVMPPLDDNMSTAALNNTQSRSRKLFNWKVWTCVGIVGFYILCTGALMIGMAQERKTAPLSWMGG